MALLELSPVAIALLKYRQVFRIACKSVGLYAFLTGVAMVFGGDARLQGPSYTSAREIAVSMGARPSLLWGLTIAVAGAVVLLSRIRCVSIVGLHAITAWSFLFSLSWAYSIHTVPLAGVTGFFTHLFIGFAVIGLIVVKKIDRGIPE